MPNATFVHDGSDGKLMGPTVQEIVTARNDTLRAIFERSLEIDTAIEAIKDRGYDRPLMPKELDEIEGYIGVLGVLAQAEHEVSLITMRLLNESSEVQRLVNVLHAVNDRLKASVNKIKKVSEILKKVSDVLGSIDGIVKSLTKLSGLLA